MLGKSLLVLTALALAAIPTAAEAKGDGHDRGYREYRGDGDRWSGRRWSRDGWSRYRYHGRRYYRGYDRYYGYYGSPRGYYRDGFAIGYHGAPYYGSYGYGYGVPYYAPPYYGGYYGAPAFVIHIGKSHRRHYYRRYRR